MDRDGKSNYQCQEVIWGHHHRAKQEAPQLSPKVSPTERTKQKTKEPYVSIRIREYEYTYRCLGVSEWVPEFRWYERRKCICELLHRCRRSPEALVPLASTSPQFPREREREKEGRRQVRSVGKNSRGEKTLNPSTHCDCFRAEYAREQLESWPVNRSARENFECNG